MEILDVSRSLYVEDMEDLLEDPQKKQRKPLSEMNIYSKIEDKKYFEDNFIKIMENKFINIYNNLNDTDIPNEKKETKNEGNKNKKEDKPLVLFFIEDRLQKIKNVIYNTSQKAFEKIFKTLYQDYSNDLQKEQSSQNKAFGVNLQIIDFNGIQKNYKEELFIYFNNEFFKNIFCIILKLFMNNLKNQLIDYYKKELKENEKMREIINKKAEDSLKYITQKLHESLLKELKENFEKKNKTANDDFDDNDFGFNLFNN